MGWWQRHRHAKGFGIHSPFAFGLLSEIVKSTYPYYAYADIDRILKEHSSLSKNNRDDMRLLFRIGARLEVAAWINRSHHRMAPQVIRLAAPQARELSSEIKPSPGHGLLIYTHGGFWEDLLPYMKYPGNIIFANKPLPGMWQKIKENMDGGVIFHNPGKILAVSRRGMSIVCHELHF